MRIEIKCLVNDSKHPGSVSKQPADYYHLFINKCSAIYWMFKFGLFVQQMLNNVRHSPNIVYNMAILSCGSSSGILHTSTSWRNQRLLEAWEINTCSSPLNRDDGLYLPKEYRASTVLDKNQIFLIYNFGFLLATIGILNKLVTSPYRL